MWRSRCGRRCDPGVLADGQDNLGDAGVGELAALSGPHRPVVGAALGVVERASEPLPYDDARAREIVGRYEIGAMLLTISTTGTRMTLEVVLKPEARAEAGCDIADYAPFDLGLLPGDADEYILTSGAFEGMRGFFTRDESGAVVGVDLAGRLFNRVPTASE